MHKVQLPSGAFVATRNQDILKDYVNFMGAVDVKKEKIEQKMPQKKRAKATNN